MSSAWRAWLVLLAAVLSLRLVIEAGYLLPSAVGDSQYFLTASVNLCRSGVFGTTAYPIDPTGQARMIWHGFVSPMMYAWLDAGCSARGYYLLHWTLQLLTGAVILLLARRRRLPAIAGVGLALFAIAAQTAVGFRPEALAILLITLAELAIEGRRYAVLGALGGTLLCTQPTVASMYALAMLALRPELLRHWLVLGVAAALTVLSWMWVYPFPPADLLTGILLQAKKLIGRDDGGVIAYYVWLPSLPGWGLLLLGVMVAAMRRRPALSLLAPLLWFFGPRVPPVYYNIIPLCFLLTAWYLQAAEARRALAAAGCCLFIGVSGLGFISLRDVLTVQRYGDTFSATRSRVASLAASGAAFGDLSSLLALSNPELDSTLPRPPRASRPGETPLLDVTAANGSPRAPCASADRDVSLSWGSRKLFNSNSGWMVYVCPRGAPVGAAAR